MVGVARSKPASACTGWTLLEAAIDEMRPFNQTFPRGKFSFRDRLEPFLFFHSYSICKYAISICNML